MERIFSEIEENNSFGGIYMVYLAAAAALAAVLWRLPVRFALCIGSGGARPFGLGVGLLPGTARKKSLRNRKKPAKVRKGLSARGRVELIRRAFALIRRGRLEEIRLSGALNLRDAARTAVAAGAADAALRGLAAAADCPVRGEIRPDFSEEGGSAQVLLTASCPLGLLAWHAAAGYLHYIKEEWADGKASH